MDVSLAGFVIPMDAQKLKETIKSHLDVLLQDFHDDDDLLKILPNCALQVRHQNVFYHVRTTCFYHVQATCLLRFCISFSLSTEGLIVLLIFPGYQRRGRLSQVKIQRSLARIYEEESPGIVTSLDTNSTRP